MLHADGSADMQQRICNCCTLAAAIAPGLLQLLIFAQLSQTVEIVQCVLLLHIACPRVHARQAAAQTKISTAAQQYSRSCNCRRRIGGECTACCAPAMTL
jgi:hypothetical protein